MSRILTFFFFFFFFLGKFETSWFEQNSYSMKLLNHWFESEYQHVWEYGSTTTFISFYQPSSRGVWPGVHGTGGYNLTRFGSPEARLSRWGGALNSFSVRDVRRCSKTTTQVIMSHTLTNSHPVQSWVSAPIPKAHHFLAPSQVQIQLLERAWGPNYWPDHGGPGGSAPLPREIFVFLRFPTPPPSTLAHSP